MTNLYSTRRDETTVLLAAYTLYLRASSNCSGVRVSALTFPTVTIFPSTGHCILRNGPRCTELNRREDSLATKRRLF